MTQSIIYEVFVVLLLTLLVGLVRAASTALSSVLKIRLKERGDEGDLRSAAALELAEAPERYRTPVHISATFMLVLLGVHFGTSAAVEAGSILAGVSFLGDYGFLLGFGGSILLLGLFVIVFGEIVPRRIAEAFPETVCRMLAPAMKRLVSVLDPLAGLLESISYFLLRTLGVDRRSGETVTEEEVKEMIREGTDLGVFEQAEEQMVNKVLKLGDKTAAALMTPRNDIVWLDIDRDLHELLNEAYESGHSSFVVAREALDTVLGIVSIGDLSRFVFRQRPVDEIKDILREPLLLPSTLSALKVLEQMRESRRHIALVVDEYGGLDGIVTTHDLIEAVVGDLSDEDEEEAGIVRRADNSCLVDAAMDVDEVLENFGLEALRQEEKRGYHSLGGFVLAHLGRIPEAGECFEYGGHQFEVVDMDRNRIDKVLIRKIPGTSGNSSDCGQENFE